jgi:P27 family predicted phage terminase small subunit
MNPKVPSHLQLLRGNPSKRALRPEPRPDPGVECPSAPSYLSDGALAVWNQVAGELWSTGRLTPLDVNVLGAFCVFADRWAAAERLLSEPGVEPVVEVRGRLVQNPLIRLSRNSAERMMAIAREFGMTAKSHGRVAVVVPPRPPAA